MNYSDTWFSKIPYVHKSSRCSDGKIVYTHIFVKCPTGVFSLMNTPLRDGSIAVLGAEVVWLPMGLSCGTRDLQSAQQSLLQHAETLRASGAIIVNQTKNKLVARKDTETAYFVISPLLADKVLQKLMKGK